MPTILDADLRPDLTAAHRDVIAAVGRPGTWWTAAERIAIASEVRRALDRADLAPWQPPSSIDGLIGADHPLPPAAVDAVWRITNHPGTLTADWYEGLVTDLPSPAHYVELVGIVAMVNSVDRLARFLDLAPLPLPPPTPGEPSRELPADVAVTTHWVPTAGVGGPNVLKALSAVPADRVVQMALAEAQYVGRDALLGDLDWDRGTLDRRQIELVAAHTSMVNECFY